MLTSLFLPKLEHFALNHVTHLSTLNQGNLITFEENLALSTVWQLTIHQTEIQIFALWVERTVDSTYLMLEKGKLGKTFLVELIRYFLFLSQAPLSSVSLKILALLGLYNAGWCEGPRAKCIWLPLCSFCCWFPLLDMDILCLHSVCHPFSSKQTSPIPDLASEQMF